MNPTQIKLIEAAEQEFAKHGFHGSSIREITTRAEANVAAVNYHFGSKENLFIEMVRHRVAPINELRLALLADALKANNGEALPLENLIGIMVRPLIEAMKCAEGASDFIRAMERGLSEENSLSEALYSDVLGEVIKTFQGQFKRSASEYPDEQVDAAWGYMFCCVAGVTMHRKRNEQKTLCQNFPNGDHLVTFILGGVNALLGN